MKGTLLEYMSCTFDVMDPMEFIQTKESSVGLRVILASTRDPKVGCSLLRFKFNMSYCF